MFLAWLCILSGLFAACDSTHFSEGGGNIMQVKVVSLEQCSATPPTIALVNKTAGEMGLAISLEHVIVKTPEEAVVHRHIGSPTVQINGLDIEPAARETAQFGIT